MVRLAGCGLVLLFAAGAPVGAQQRFVLPPPAPGAPGEPGPQPGRGPRQIRPVLTHPGPPKLDRHGDPLPAGAVTRYGTVRLRHGAEVRAMSFTPDGKLLCTMSGTEDSIKLWDVATGKSVASVSTTAHLVGLANAKFAVLVDDRKCKVWMYDTGGVRDLPDRTLPEGASPTALAVNPDSKSFAVATSGKVLLIDVQTGRTLRELNLPPAERNNENAPRLGRGGNPRPGQPEVQPPPVPPVRLLYSPDGKWLAGNGDSTGVWLWDLRTGKRVRTYRTELELPDYVFSPDVTKLAITGARPHLYALDSEEPVEGFKGPEGVVLFALRFSADGKTVGGVRGDGGVGVLDAETGEEKDGLEAPDEDLRPPFAQAAQGALVAAVDMTGGIRVWDPKTGKGPAVDRLPALFDAALGAKGVTLIDEKGRVHAFDPATGAPGKVLEPAAPSDGLTATWDAGSRRVAHVVTGGDNLEVQFADADTQKVLSRYELAADGGVPFVSFAAGNRDRVALFDQGGVVVLNPATGKLIRTIAAGRVSAELGGGRARGALSPDGRLVAAVAGEVGVWEVATGKKRFTLEAGPNVEYAAFSSDGRFLAAADGGAVHVYDVRTGTSVRKVQSAETGEPISALGLSAGGKRLALGFVSGHVTVWDVSTGDVLAPFAGHDGMVTAVSFAPDGKRLVSCAMDGTAVVWEVPEQPQKAGPADAVVTGFDEAFRLLGATDAAQAQRGLNYLYRRPEEAPKQLGERIVPPAPVPAARLAQLVADLGSEEFPTREAAVGALEKAGGEAAPLLREAVAKSTSPEVRKLATELLGKLDAPATKPDDLRALRAVEALEGLRTPEALALLERWAAGPKGHRVTTEAAAAVGRLKPAVGK